MTGRHHRPAGAVGVFHGAGERQGVTYRHRRRPRMSGRVRLALSLVAVTIGGAMLLGSAWLLAALHWPLW